MLLRNWSMYFGGLVMNNQAFQWKWRHINLGTSTLFSSAQNPEVLSETPQRKRLNFIRSDHNGYIKQCELHCIHWWVIRTELKNCLP